jgi:hypothetical protein
VGRALRRRGREPRREEISRLPLLRENDLRDGERRGTSPGSVLRLQEVDGCSNRQTEGREGAGVSLWGYGTVNPHTAALVAAVGAVRPVDRAISGDGLRWLQAVRSGGIGVPGAPLWYDDVETGEVVRIADGSRYRIEDVTPLCVRGEIDLHAVDEWIRTAPATRKE